MLISFCFEITPSPPPPLPRFNKVKALSVGLIGTDGRIFIFKFILLS